MKKFLAITTVCLLAHLLSAFPALAEENGYIFKLKKDAIILFSENEKVSFHGDDVYSANSLDDIYEFAPENMIEYVVPDFKLELYDADYPAVTSDTSYSQQWNLKEIYAEAAREKGLSGKGVRIGIIDSGIDASHPDIDSSKILTGFNCMDDNDDANDYDTTDVYGHGTNVCGIISAITDNESHLAGIAPNASIIPIKVTNSNSFGVSVLLDAIETAIYYDCDVINMSLGGNITDEILINVLKEKIDKAANAGIIIVAAAGNENSTAVSYPAGYDNVIGVGSVKSDLTHSKYSQRNDSVFISAPGHGVTTLKIGNSTSSETGTSIATPHITAIVALIKEILPDASLSDIKEILKNSSTDLGDEGYDTTFGNGLVNIEKIVESLDEYMPDIVISDGIKNGLPRIHIHNNSNSITDATGYFASYSDNSIDNISTIIYSPEKSGVTTYSSLHAFDSFFLWDSKLVPYVKKYDLK